MTRTFHIHHAGRIVAGTPETTLCGIDYRDTSKPAIRSTSAASPALIADTIADGVELCEECRAAYGEQRRSRTPAENHNMIRVLADAHDVMYDRLGDEHADGISKCDCPLHIIWTSVQEVIGDQVDAAAPDCPTCGEHHRAIDPANPSICLRDERPPNRTPRATFGQWIDRAVRGVAYFTGFETRSPLSACWTLDPAQAKKWLIGATAMAFARDELKAYDVAVEPLTPPATALFEMCAIGHHGDCEAFDAVGDPCRCACHGEPAPASHWPPESTIPPEVRALSGLLEPCRHGGHSWCPRVSIADRSTRCACPCHSGQFMALPWPEGEAR